MKILVVYDSYFGNTETVAQTIGNELSKEHVTKIVKVKNTNATELAQFDLVIIGSPTRAFSPTKAIASLVKNMPTLNNATVKFAVFDTRMNVQKLDNKLLKLLEKGFGNSNDTLTKLLKRKKYTLIGQSHFYVLESEGPLGEGEIDKAIEFAKMLPSKIK